MKRKPFSLLLSACMELMRYLKGQDCSNRALWSHFARHYNPLFTVLEKMGTFAEAPAPSQAGSGSPRGSLGGRLRGDISRVGRPAVGGLRQGGVEESRASFGAGSSRDTLTTRGGFVDDDDYFSTEDRHVDAGPLVPAVARSSLPTLLPIHHQTAASSDFEFN